MSILFAGTEGESFATTQPPFVNAPNSNTNTYAYDSNFSRVGVQLYDDNYAFAAVDLGGITDVWTRIRVGSEGLKNDVHTGVYSVWDNGGQEIVRLSTSSSGMYMQYWNGSSWVSGATYNPSIATTELAIHCNIHDTAGSFAWYVGGTLIEEVLSGDTNLFAATAHYVSVRGWYDFDNIYFSEMVIADEDCRGMRVATIYPTAAGTTGAWTGAYTDVDETQVNDSDFISSDTADQVSTYTMSDLAAALDAYDVVAFVGATRSLVGVTGPANLQIAVRTGGTDYYSSNLSGMTTSFLNGHNNIWATNPDTASAWTISEIEGLELGVKSIT